MFLYLLYSSVTPACVCCLCLFYVMAAVTLELVFGVVCVSLTDKENPRNTTIDLLAIQHIKALGIVAITLGFLSVQSVGIYSSEN